VVGAGGLLGRAVSTVSGDAFTPGAIPWGTAHAEELLRAAAPTFVERAGDGPWRAIWVAGSATTATSAADTTAELQALRAWLTGLREHRPTGSGAVFIASSAGGIYAGSDHPPFTAHSTPRPMSAYGELKLEQEELAQRMLAGVAPVVIGRISNAYGPGQNLAKLQGLVSRLVLAAATRRAINIFVPLDTIRDYVFAPDAARAILSATDAAMRSERSSIEIIASGEPVTVGQVIRTVDQVTKRRVPVALGTHPSSASQARDLRVLPTVAGADATPFPAGVKAVFLDIVERLQREPLSA
jgi:UDP-glucose 4-epimerase